MAHTPELSPAARRLLERRAYDHSQALEATLRAQVRYGRTFAGRRDWAVWKERQAAQGAACRAFIRAIQYISRRTVTSCPACVATVTP